MPCPSLDSVHLKIINALSYFRVSFTPFNMKELKLFGQSIKNTHKATAILNFVEILYSMLWFIKTHGVF